jgi:hypothetical protein
MHIPRTRSLLTVLLLASIWLLAQPQEVDAADEPAALGFYRSLAVGIAETRGNAVLHLREGHFRTTVGNTTIIWDIAKDSSADVSFEYMAGALKRARIEFRRPVHVSLLQPSRTSNVGLNWIQYKADGTVKDAYVWSDHPHLRNADLKLIVPLLRWASSPASMFLGLPLAYASLSQECDARGEHVGRSRSLVRVVHFEQKQNERPLHVVLKPDAEVRFSSRDISRKTFDNAALLASPGSFDFERFSYDVEAQAPYGIVRQMDLSLQAGELNSEGLSFRLRGDSRMQFEKVDFGPLLDSSELNATTVHATGNVEARIAKGSSIVLAQHSPEPVTVVLGDASYADLRGFDLNVREYRSTALSFGPTARLDAVISPGTSISFGSHGYLHLLRGTLAVEFDRALWESERAPLVKGTIQSLGASIQYGRVDLTSAPITSTLSGDLIEGTGLRLDSGIKPPITGSFQNVVFRLQPSTEFGTPEGFTLTAGTKALLTANRPEAPYTLLPNLAYPVGRYVVDASFDDMRRAPVPQFDLKVGQAKLYMHNSPEGAVETYEVSTIRGSVAPTSRMKFGLEGEVRFSDGTLAANVRQARWAPHQRPVARGTITQLDAGISDGVISLNRDPTKTRLQSGKVTADALTFDTELAPNITGPFTAVSFQFREGEEFRIPGGFVFQLRSTSRLTANDSSVPLRLVTGLRYPVGRFILNLQFTKFRNVPNPVLVLTPGDAVLFLENAADGTITSFSPCKLTGQLILDWEGGSASLPIQLSEGELQAPANGTPRFEATLSGTIPPGIEVISRTPFIRGVSGHPDFRLFPISATITTRVSSAFPSTPILFFGRQVLKPNGAPFALDLAPILNIDIPSGSGRYLDPDNLDRGTMPDDEFGRMQELLRVTRDHAHLFVKPRTHQVTVPTTVSITDQGLSITFNRASLLAPFSEEAYRFLNTIGTLDLNAIRATIEMHFDDQLRSFERTWRIRL